MKFNRSREHARNPRYDQVIEVIKKNPQALAQMAAPVIARMTEMELGRSRGEEEWSNDSPWNDVLREDGFWSYVKKHDKKLYAQFKNMVFKHLDRWIKETKNPDPKNKDVKPRASGQGAGGPGGAPPPGGGLVGESKILIKKYAAQLCLYKPHGRYKLNGTLAGALLAGKVVYPKPNSKMCFLHLKTSNAKISSSGPAAKSIADIQENMGNEIARSIEEALKSKSPQNVLAEGPDAQQVAKAIVSLAPEWGTFDLTPAATYLYGPSEAMKVAVGAKDEPSEIIDIRNAIGQVIDPKIENLKMALMQENVVLTEKYVPETELEEAFEIDNGTPEVLHKQKIGSSVNPASLIMTMSHADSDPESRDSAMDRLIRIMCRHPHLYEKNPLTVADLETMGASSKHDFSRLKPFVSLWHSEPKDFHVGLSQIADPYDRFLASHLASRKENLVDLDPSLSVFDNGSETWVNEYLLNKIDHKNPVGSEFLRGLVRSFQTKNFRSGKNAVIKRILDLVQDSDDESLWDEAATSHWIPAHFGLCKMAEKGNEKLIRKLMRRIPARSALRQIPKANRHTALAAGALASRFENDVLLKKIRNMLGTDPKHLLPFAGNNGIKRYMKSNRLGWDGHRVPLASDLIELPRNPLHVISGMNDIEDVPGLLSLLHMCAEKKGSARPVDMSLKMILNFLSKLNAKESAQDVLKNFGMSWDGGDIEKLDESKNDPSQEGIIAAAKLGDFVLSARLLARLFKENEEAAMAALNAMPEPEDKSVFVALLPKRILSRRESLPEWILDELLMNTTAELLPSGQVVVKFGFDLDNQGKSFPGA